MLLPSAEVSRYINVLDDGLLGNGCLSRANIAEVVIEGTRSMTVRGLTPWLCLERVKSKIPDRTADHSGRPGHYAAFPTTPATVPTGFSVYTQQKGSRRNATNKK